MAEQYSTNIGPDPELGPSASAQPPLANTQQPQIQHPSTSNPSSTQSYRLSPQTEDGLKAAVTSAMPAQDLDPIRWMIYKNALRWISLALCITIVIGEVVVAVAGKGSAAIDTASGIPWALVLGIWSIWRIVHLRRTRKSESFSKISGIGEGLAMITGLALFFTLVYICVNLSHNAESKPWFEMGARYGILMIGVVFLAAIHTTIFVRLCFEKHRGTALYGEGSMEIPQYLAQPQAQPAQIIVQYVHTCSKCGVHTEPKPGEALNEVLAARGEMQPQAFSSADYRHAH